MKVKHIDNLYTWEQIDKLSNVNDSNPRNDYISVSLYTPCEGYMAHCGGEPDYYSWYGRKRAFYAKRVWEQARLQLQDLEAESTAFEIVPASECFNTIRFINPIKNSEYTKRFWATLESVANSKTISCYVGRMHTRPYPWDLAKLEEELVIEDDVPYEPYRAHPEIVEGCECAGFSWDEIKDCFVELTEDELALLHGEQVLNRRPTEIDKELLVACDRLDIDGVRSALSKGGNPNAFSDGPWAEGALSIMINTYSHKGDDANAVRLLEAIKILLDAGCDIDLSPCGGTTALYEATMSDPSVVKFLLENGANPNTICWIDPQDCSMATALDSVAGDIACHGNLPELEEMFKLIEDAGGKYLGELRS